MMISYDVIRYKGRKKDKVLYQKVTEARAKELIEKAEKKEGLSLRMVKRAK